MDGEENKEFKEGTDISGYGSFGKTENGTGGQIRPPMFSATGKPHPQTRLTNLIIKFSGGRIQSEKQATYILLVLAGIIFIISLFFWFS